VKLFERRKEKPPGAVVTLETSCPRAFSIRSLGAIETWFCEIGYSRRILSNDRDFDARFSISCWDFEFAEALIRDPEVRDAVASLDERRFKWLQYRPGTGWLQVQARGWPFVRRKPERDRVALEQLSRVQSAIARLTAAKSFPPATRSQRWALIALAVWPVVALVLAAVEFLRLLSRVADVRELFDFLQRSLLYSVPLAMAISVAHGIRFVGGVRAHERFLGTSYRTFVATVILVGGSAMLANHAFDTAEPTMRQPRVLGVRRDKEKQERVGWYAQVESWRPERGPRQVIYNLSREMAHDLQSGEGSLSVLSHPGWLGLEWISDARVEKAGMTESR